MLTRAVDYMNTCAHQQGVAVDSAHAQVLQDCRVLHCRADSAVSLTPQAGLAVQQALAHKQGTQAEMPHLRSGWPPLVQRQRWSSRPACP